MHIIIKQIWGFVGRAVPIKDINTEDLDESKREAIQKILDEVNFFTLKSVEDKIVPDYGGSIIEIDGHSVGLGYTKEGSKLDKIKTKLEQIIDII